MAMDRPDDRFLNAIGYKRISTRQIDELIGMARMVAADGTISAQEAELLRNWLAANIAIVDSPMIAGRRTRFLSSFRATKFHRPTSFVCSSSS